MKTKHSTLSQISLSLGLAVALALGIWFLGTARAQDHAPGHAADHPADHAKGPPDMVQMGHIMTQAQAEALKPGDSMSMTCSKCKVVTVQKVTANKAHVKMMTIGEKLKCPACKGSVEVVAAGKGEGKDAEVKHVCSKCGDDAMFCAATKPGSGGMKDMKDMDKGKK